MSNDKIRELGSQRPGMDQISRARELCGESADMNAHLDAFLGTQPSRSAMIAFMDELKTTGMKKEMQAKIARICESVGIDSPTGTDRLLALQIGLLREQNEALALLANRTGQVVAQTQQQASIFGPLLAGILIGKMS